MKLSLRQLKLGSRFVILVLGLLQAWAGRFYIDPDGVNYLDIAQAYARHDWVHAINGYWSPLYSWLLAIIEIIFRPAPYWESTWLHVLNYFFFVMALVAFEFFLSRLLSLINFILPEGNNDPARPAWAWWLLGYTAFAVCTLRIITLSNDTPDMALAALVFLATGCLIDLRESQRGSFRYALLGAILGVAYFSKGVMFPVFFVFLVSTAFARGGLKKPDLRALATLAGFLVVSTPFVAALSHVKGHLTFGETGKVAYIHEVLGGDEHSLISVDRLTREDAKHNQPQHLPQRISENPPAYIYETPYTLATYPALYDASYWWSARTPNFSLRDQVRAIGRSATSFFHIFSTEKQWIAGWLALAFLAFSWKRMWARLRLLWFIWLPSLATLGLYSLVLVEPRYTAVWITIILLSLFAAVDWPQLESARSTGAAVILAIAVTSGVAVVKGGVDSLADCLRKEPHLQFEIGQSLLGMGLQRGDQVAFIGQSILPYYWAHLSGLRVTGDVQAGDLYSYWTAPQQKRNEIAVRFQANGIKALVMSGPPAVQDGWRPIDGTGYYVQFLAGNGGENAEKPASPPTSDLNSR